MLYNILDGATYQTLIAEQTGNSAAAAKGANVAFA